MALACAVAACVCGCSGTAPLVTDWQQLGAPDAACIVAGSAAAPEGAFYTSLPDAAASLGRATLIHIDCTGGRAAGLATSWSHGDSSNVFGFRGPGLDTVDTAAWRDSRVDSIVQRHDETIVYTAEHHADIPAFLGAPPFVASHALTTAQRDERDVLESGIEVMVTRRREVISYARERGTWTVTALPWNATYSIVAPGGFGDGSQQRLPVLLEGSVRADVRPFTPDSAAARCNSDVERMASGGVMDQPLSPRVVFDERDHIAAELAARMVSLVSRGRVRPGGNWSSTGSPVVAVGVTGAVMQSLLEDGSDFLYVTEANHLASPNVACVPVLTTRSYLVTSPNAPAVTLDLFGMPTLLPVSESGR